MLKARMCAAEAAREHRRTDNTHSTTRCKRKLHGDRIARPATTSSHRSTPAHLPNRCWARANSMRAKKTCPAAGLPALVAANDLATSLKSATSGTRRSFESRRRSLASGWLHGMQEKQGDVGNVRAQGHKASLAAPACAALPRAAKGPARAL